MSTEEIVDEDGYNVVPEDEPVNIFIFIKKKIFLKSLFCF